MWNGREFNLTIHENKDGDRSRFVGWIQVVDKPEVPRNRGTFTGLSEAEVQEKAEAWMRKWRN
jgi:hypothetical protein